MFNETGMDLPNAKNMLDVALDYVAKGWPVFPLRPGAKTPMVSGGFSSGTTDTAQIKEWWEKHPTANIGIATGACSSLVVLDVDVKNGKNGVRALEKLSAEHGGLPDTLTCSTPSGGFHYYFRHPGTETRGSVGALGEGLDTRGDGGYIVAPPSIIEGNHYAWDNWGAEVAEMPQWILKSKRASNTSIKEGERNNYIFKIAAALRGKSVPIEDAEVEVLSAAAKCDPPLPEEEAISCLNSAYQYPAGEEIPEEIKELNEKHAVVRVGGACRILSEVYDPVLGLDDIAFSSTANFKELYGNRKLNEKKLGEAWLEHPDRRQYESVIFAPGVEKTGYYNLWRGFPLKSKEGDCSLYLDHVKDNIANGDEEIYHYLLAWMADVIQRPRDLPGVAVVLRGKQGTGKGVFATEFGKLFGKHFKHLAHGKHLTGNFNNHLKDALLVFADEAFWGGKKESEGTLKALITEERLTIEGKGLDQYFVKNHIHLMMASNNEWVVPASFEERRFLILDVSDRHQQDHGYFSAIREQMDNGGREAFLHYLENFDLSKINLRAAPKTKALFETKLLSMSPIEKFWHERLQLGTLQNSDTEWKTEIPVIELKEAYKDFLKDLSVSPRFSDEEFGKKLRKLVPHLDRYRPMINGVRQGYHYGLPPLKDCREFFRTITHMDIRWEVEENIDTLEF